MELAKKLHPDDRLKVVRVLLNLENDLDRGVRKFDLNITTADGKPEWGYMEDRVWLAFVEEEDGQITVESLTLHSRMRPPPRGPWSLVLRPMSSASCLGVA